MRALYAIYALFAYLVFGAALVLAIAFLTWPAGPLVDHGPKAPPALAVAIDVALLGLFAAQHTAMARKSFKRTVTRLLPVAAERSTFVLAASSVLIVLVLEWRPLPSVVWSLPGTFGDAVLVIGVGGWLLLVSATFMIDHFDLFGLKQGWLAARGRRYAYPAFQSRWLYAWVRHPIMTGFLIVFWAVPRMTVGHLLFSAAATGYILVGVRFEERDLTEQLLGYESYRRRVGAFLPRLLRVRSGARAAPEGQ